MPEKNAQVAIEILIAALILLSMLIVTAALIMQKNANTSGLGEVQNDIIECQRIAGMITSFNSNSGYSETAMQPLKKSARVEKSSILINPPAGNISCHYNGNARLQTSGVPDYEEDVPDGFALEKGESYKVKKTSAGVVFCNALQGWC